VSKPGLRNNDRRASTSSLKGKVPEAMLKIQSDLEVQ